MTYSLIANSGIQLYTSHIVIDSNATSKHLFHEWFDEEQVETNIEVVFQLPESKKIVALNDLERYRFISEEGKLIVSEQQVLAVPDLRIIHEGGDIQNIEGIFAMKLSDRRCQVSKLLNQWLPLPVFELDLTGEFKQGPYNWCRCKIIPKGPLTNDKIEADVLLAFDTRALYMSSPDEYAECPIFDSTSERHKDFKLCERISHLMDFCSGNNLWVKNYLMQLVHGVSDVDDIVINKNEQDYRYAFLASYFLLVEYLQKSLDLPAFRLIRDRGIESTNVDMAIDIGNSRTSAVLFENGDFTKVKPLRLQNFSQPIKGGQLNRSDESFNMRLAFQKVSFGEHVLDGSKQFIWPSLVRLGDEAEYLTHLTTSLAEGDEVLSTYSSPKRYLWDFAPRREEWRWAKSEQDDNSGLPIIEGVSNYLSDDGSIDKEGLGYGLHYSRRSLMTLAFMEILSQAKVQINTNEYREFNGRISSPRHLNKIIITCPTAMSKQEQKSLHNSLKEALYILEKFGMYSDDTFASVKVQIVPDLDSHNDDCPQWIFDEATCSQFVYLYGQFKESYKNNCLEFFNLYGKKRQNEAGEESESVIIGSIDIGAGTSDIMVCKYEYDASNLSRLKPIPLFWDSFDYAGDDMMRVLISNILIQGDTGIIEKELLKRGYEQRDARAKLYHFFGEDHNTLSFKDRILRRDFNLQVLVPLMYHFLELLSNNVVCREVKFSDVFAENMPSEDGINHFAQTFGFNLQEIKWAYDKDIMSQNIEKTLNGLLENIATIMYAYDCDIILLSGRPSSLQPIKDIFLKFFPVAPNRLIVLNKHRIGKWYPFADEHGFIHNSKSIVAIGAMIGHLASSTGRLTDFSLDLSELGSRIKPTTDYFVVKDSKVNTNTSFITPKTSSGTITINSFPLYIGCRQYDMRLYPVRPFLVIDIDKNSISDSIRSLYPDKSEGELAESVNNYCAQLANKVPYTFTIDREDFDEDKEHLTISNVENNTGDTVSTSDFSLTIQSLNDPDCYWLDSGAFNINISSNL